LLLGLSVVVWFPYILSFPAVFCYAWFVREDDEGPGLRQRAAFLLGVVGGAAAVVMLTYGCVMLAGHFTSLEEISHWIARSRHGLLPNRGILRMLGSIPRGFLSLGQGSTVWKRMIFDHQSFSVGLLVRAGISKVALVYVVLAASAAALCRSSWGRRQLVCLFVVALPLGILAAIFLDASSPERYVAAFPCFF
jgi:hypothetical protein